MGIIEQGINLEARDINRYAIMNATLYLPRQRPQTVSTEGLELPDSLSGFTHVPERVAMLLGCAPGLVDVLANGPKYVAYSIFDSEDEVNHEAMAAVAAVSGATFDAEDEDMILCGAILIVLAD